MTERRTRVERRAGYVVAAVVNLVVLWVASHLLEWEWPPFLTRAYDDLLPWIQVSLVATVAANLLWVVWDPEWFHHLGEAALSAVSVAVAIRSWQLFPFDFTTYSSIWEVGARALILVAGVGAAIGMVVGIGRAIGAAAGPGRMGHARPA